ncbi:hypothetical protein C6500_10375 [Candidatus Poribacteria bacterium]|nr:MAG: hypothetical protein C6500_10375 [Candidatus Poribacteria bacterium]
MRIKKLSSALLISVALHFIFMFIVESRFSLSTHYSDDIPELELLYESIPLRPRIRKAPKNVPVIIPRGVTPSNTPVPTAVTNVDLPASDAPSALAFPAEATPPNTPTPTVVIHADLPVSDAPGALALSAPVAEGGVPQVKVAFERPPGLAMVENVGGSRGGSGTTSQSMILGYVKAPQWYPSLNPPNGAVYGDVFFKGSDTNPFIDTEDDAFSTFGMDVDTASYTVARRFFQDGLLPPSEAIRVEEFVNAFAYNYTPPSDETFAIHLEGAPSKFGEGKRLQLLRIGIQGRVIPDTDRKDAILTFVIDVSGSMDMENRLALVKRALTLLVEQLRPEDKVGIVVYGSNARVVLPHTGIVNQEHILTAIRALTTEGATNAEAGLRMGYKLAFQNFKPNAINRVILCSDGVANVGETGSDAILKEIRTYVKEGVTLTTAGFGMGNYNDILMERLANDGNGSYAYVDTLNEAKRVFVENLTGTLQVVAKDAKIQVEFNPETVSRFRLLGYENRRLAHEDFRDDAVDAGEVGAGHSVTALYEIKLHENADGKLATVSIRHENPDTGNVTEVNASISTDALKGSFEETTPAFQLVASVAEFAEILRGNFWAQEGSLELVRETLEGILPHINAKTRAHSVRNEELLSLVRKAHRLKEQQKEG